MKAKKTLLTSLNLLLTATVGVVATWSWMSKNNKVDSSNMGLDIQEVSNLTTVSCYALRYDGIIGARCYEVTSGTVVQMAEYDQVFKDRNVNTPLIYRIEMANILTTPGTYLSLKVPCKQEYVEVVSTSTNSNEFTASYEVVDADKGTYKISNKDKFKIRHYISNVARIKFGAGDHNLEPVETTTEHIDVNEQIFKQEVADFNAVSEGAASKTFSSLEFDSAKKQIKLSKTNEIELRINYSEYSSLLFDGFLPGESKSSKHLILYIFLDYDNALMEMLINTLSADQNVNFANDFSTLTITNGGA